MCYNTWFPHTHVYLHQIKTMKSLTLLLLLSAALLSTGGAASAQEKISVKPSDSTIVFKVFGVCEMCKKRIEEAAQGRGIRTAGWNQSTKMLSLVFDPRRANIKKVHDRIAAAGYDTHEKKATDAAYKQLPDCCKYREFDSMDDMYPKEVMDTVKAPVADTVTGQNEAPAPGANNIHGVVFERDENGNSIFLPGASIRWLDHPGGTLSDDKGEFSIPYIGQPGQLIISHVGLTADTVFVQSRDTLLIVLTTGKQLQGVTVVAPRRGATYIGNLDPFRTTVITKRELLKAACCNLSESFETNPSVDVSFSDAVTGSKQIQLLGLSGNYSQLTVENLPGPRGLATSLGLNSIPGTWIESIQLVKGTGSVANGFESIAGQINVELKKPQTSERLYVNVYANDFEKVDLNLNLTQAVGKHWSTTLLLHDAFLHNNKIDFNKDGFRDLPTGNLFSAVNRWSYDNHNGLITHLGVKWLEDRKTGGEVAFDPLRDKLTTNHYGLGIDIGRYEAFAKIGYMFPGEAHKSIGLQLSAFAHKQDSYFGMTTYKGKQQNAYANLIYQSQIGNSKHKFRTGLNFVFDKYDEEFNVSQYKRTEAVTGGFFEYTFAPVKNFDAVLGIRQDHNSIYGWFSTPRLNVRYEPVTGTIIRSSVGRGQRTANIFAENNSVFVSARSVSVPLPAGGKAYGLDPEVAWNKGISIDQKLRLFQRNATIGMEFFRNDFVNQVIVDLEDAHRVRFYNLDGKSFSNSFQTELSFEPVANLTARFAYRYFNVQATYGDQLLQKPFTAKQRGFANLGYETKGWKFDYTLSYNGSKRIPSTEALPDAYKRATRSPAYATMNAQVSKTLGKDKNIDLYIGGENLGNFFQPDVITAADQPFGSHFDASMVWGPLNGRMLYGGVRFSLK